MYSLHNNVIFIYALYITFFFFKFGLTSIAANVTPNFVDLLQILYHLLQKSYCLLQKLYCLLQIMSILLQIFKSIFAFAFVNGLPSASIGNKYWICI